MADSFTGEIRIFAFQYPPAYWAQCNGQTMTVQQNQVLFAVIGYQFGGVKDSSYNLPNSQTLAMAGTDPSGRLGNPTIGHVDGSKTVTITNTTYPSHTHAVQAAFTTTPAGYVNVPTGTNVLGRSNNERVYATSSDVVELNQASVSYSRSQNAGVMPHENQQPFLALNFCICLLGDFFPIRP